MARAIGGQLGNYRIVALIGEGGMGEVFLGEHEVLGRRAAIKVLRSELSGNQDLVQRFFNEARETARLRSPAFVEIFDSGRLPDGSAYLVMELLRGENLGAHLQRVGRLPWPHALAVAREIAAAGGVAHGSGIIHRDLKPDNVFLSLSKPERGGEADGAGAGDDRVTVKLLDFGIAKVKGAGGAEGVARTRTGLILGTPLYMSPEQCRGTGAIDHRTDIYSSGCILHAMLSGKPPFPLDGFGEVIAAQLSTPPPLLRALGVEVPDALEALVRQMLAKGPDARPADMAAVVAAIDRVLAELPEKPTLQALAVRESPLLPVAAADAGAGAVGAADATGVAAAATAAPAVAAISAGGTRLATERPPDGDVGAGGTRLLQPSAGRSSGTLSSAAAESRSPAPAPGRGRRWGAGLAVAAVGGAGALLLLLRVGPQHHAEERPVPVVPVVPAVDPKPAPPPPQPPAPPPAPTSIQVRFTSDPAGATVVDGATDAVLGETPFDATFPRKAPGAKMQLLVRRSGYRSRKVKLGLDEDGSVQVTLDKKEGTPAVVRKNRRKL